MSCGASGMRLYTSQSCVPWSFQSSCTTVLFSRVALQLQRLSRRVRRLWWQDHSDAGAESNTNTCGTQPRSLHNTSTLCFPHSPTTCWLRARRQASSGPSSSVEGSGLQWTLRRQPRHPKRVKEFPKKTKFCRLVLLAEGPWNKYMQPKAALEMGQRSSQITGVS